MLCYTMQNFAVEIIHQDQLKVSNHLVLFYLFFLKKLLFFSFLLNDQVVHPDRSFF